ncbi:class II aldolase/adducin family protein [Methanobrevibacter sp. OttesenSCG-928-I08]|nr:class II aldolase/adducin family protein [Methanobrevibacter sp. OttesenSCG-928-I08]
MESAVKEIVNVSKYLFNRKLVSGKAGNVSSRVKTEFSDIIAITPTMQSLADIKEEDVVLLDLDGNLLTKGKPSSEFKLHLSIYKKRPDVNGIVHTHSPFATGFSFSTKRIKRLEGFGKISTPYLEDIDYEIPGSDELALKSSLAIGKEDVLILKHHGVLATGESVEEAGALAEFVEDIAKTQFISHMLNISE